MAENQNQNQPQSQNPPKEHWMKRADDWLKGKGKDNKWGKTVNRLGNVAATLGAGATMGGWDGGDAGDMVDAGADPAAAAQQAQAAADPAAAAQQAQAQQAQAQQVDGSSLAPPTTAPTAPPAGQTDFEVPDNFDGSSSNIELPNYEPSQLGPEYNWGNFGSGDTADAGAETDDNFGDEDFGDYEPKNAAEPTSSWNDQFDDLDDDFDSAMSPEAAEGGEDFNWGSFGSGDAEAGAEPPEPDLGDADPTGWFRNNRGPTDSGLPDYEGETDFREPPSDIPNAPDIDHAGPDFSEFEGDPEYKAPEKAPDDTWVEPTRKVGPIGGDKPPSELSDYDIQRIVKNHDYTQAMGTEEEKKRAWEAYSEFLKRNTAKYPESVMVAPLILDPAFCPQKPTPRQKTDNYEELCHIFGYDMLSESNNFDSYCLRRELRKLADKLNEMNLTPVEFILLAEDWRKNVGWALDSEPAKMASKLAGGLAGGAAGGAATTALTGGLGSTAGAIGGYMGGAGLANKARQKAADYFNKDRTQAAPAAAGDPAAAQGTAAGDPTADYLNALPGAVPSAQGGAAAPAAAQADAPAAQGGGAAQASDPAAAPAAQGGGAATDQAAQAAQAGGVDHAMLSQGSRQASQALQGFSKNLTQFGNEQNNKPLIALANYLNKVAGMLSDPKKLEKFARKFGDDSAASGQTGTAKPTGKPANKNQKTPQNKKTKPQKTQPAASNTSGDNYSLTND